MSTKSNSMLQNVFCFSRQAAEIFGNACPEKSLPARTGVRYLLKTVQALLRAEPRPVVFGFILLLTFTPVAIASHGANLIIGGNGEDGACSDDVDVVTTVPGWTVMKGSPKVLCYSHTKYDVPMESERGEAFIAGGPYGDSTLTQSVDVSSAATAIDSGGVTFSFSGWFGGEETNPGRASVTIRFIDAKGQSLGKPLSTSPVTPAVRGNTSKFIEQSLHDVVPAGTRSIALSLDFTYTAIDLHSEYRFIRAINTGYADNLSLTLSTPVKTTELAPPPSAVPAFDHVFLIMMENTTYIDLMTHLHDTPFMEEMLRRGAQLTNMVGIDHPSDQNYLAIAGGSAFVKGGRYFPDIRLNAKHIGDSLDAAGKTWMGYEQGMGVPCGTTTQYDKYFAADDLPFIHFVNIRDDRERCEKHLVDASEFRIDLKLSGTTPSFAWIEPDDYYDGESSYNEGGLTRSLQAQDQWLEETLTTIFDSPAWKQQRSLLIVTWDESYYPHTQNQIPTFALASQGLIRAGYESNCSANLYSIARTIEQALGIPALTSNDKYAAPLNDIFSEHGTANGQTSSSTTNPR